MAEDPSLSTPTHSSPNADFRREVLANRKLILASNRGPVDYALNESGGLEPRRAAGGVVSALAALSRNTAVTWLSAAMSDEDRLAANRPDLPRPHFLPQSLDHKFVAVPEEVLHRHYNVFSNPILWFIHHYLWNAAYGPQIDARAHEAYKDGYVVVNRAVAEALAPLAVRSRGGLTPFTLLQDYQLYLVPGFLRERCPEAILSHFIHTPWPAPNYWLLIPHYMRHAIVESLCQADVLGFQTQEFARNFLNTCEDFLEGANIDYHNRIVRYRDILSGSRSILSQSTSTNLGGLPFPLNAKGTSPSCVRCASNRQLCVLTDLSCRRTSSEALRRIARFLSAGRTLSVRLSSLPSWFLLAQRFRSTKGTRTACSGWLTMRTSASENQVGSP